MNLAFYVRKGSDSLQFEYYVLNYDCNQKKVIPFNIFRNINVQEYTEREVRKYLRSPKNYKFERSYRNEEPVYGFDALVKEIDSIIAWQERGRREYEVSVGDAFETDCDKLEKWDCYGQASPNMKMITHEVIRQYKEQKKAKDGE